jgi:hypothetical protein
MPRMEISFKETDARDIRIWKYLQGQPTRSRNELIKRLLWKALGGVKGKPAMPTASQRRTQSRVNRAVPSPQGRDRFAIGSGFDELQDLLNSTCIS